MFAADGTTGQRTGTRGVLRGPRGPKKGKFLSICLLQSRVHLGAVVKRILEVGCGVLMYVCISKCI